MPSTRQAGGTYVISVNIRVFILHHGGVHLPNMLNMLHGVPAGPAANATITLAAALSATVGAANAQPPSVFTLMVRIPTWTIAGRATVTVNGVPWRLCPGAPKPETYCEITRWAKECPWV